MVSLKIVKDAMLHHRVYTWQVKTRSKSLIGYQMDDKMSYEQSCKMLDELLEGARVDFVVIEVNKAKQKGPAGDKFKILKFEVELTGEPIQTKRENVSGVPSNITKLLEAQNATILTLKERLIELRYKAKIDELEKKIEGIRDESPINSFINSMGPTLAQILPGLLLNGNNKPQPAPINGPDAVSMSLDRISKVVPDIDVDELLEKLADYAETNPEQFRNLIKFL